MFRVKDLEASAKFYVDRLGLRLAWRDADRGMIGFTSPESDSEVVIHTDASIPSPDFCFLVDDVEAFVAEHKADGYRVIQEPIEIRSGKLALLADPDGNAIQIVDLSKFSGNPRYDLR